MEKSGLLDRLRESHFHFDPDAVFAAAKLEKVCPFEVQLELARRADAITADYNYVFDPGSALSHLDREGLGSAILLIDEAHNLPDRARKIFSPELAQEQFRDVAGRLLLQQGELFEALSRIVEDAAALLQTTAAALEESVHDRRSTTACHGVAGVVETMGAALYPLPLVETGSQAGPGGRPRGGFAFRVATLHGDLEFVRAGLRVRGRKASGGRAAGAGLSGPGAGHRAGLQGCGFGDFIFRHAVAGGRHPAPAWPGEGSNRIPDAAAAVSAREPQGDDFAASADDVRRAREELRADRPIGRANVRRPAGQRPGLVSELSVSGASGGENAADLRELDRATSESGPAGAREHLPSRSLRRRAKACCSLRFWAACMPRAWIIRENC